MDSSIYISSERLEVLGYVRRSGGRVKIKAYSQAVLPEGTVISGKITDAHAVADCLRTLKSQNPRLFKRVSVTIEGSAVLMKRLTVPKLGKRRLAKLVADEFADGSDALGVFISDYRAACQSSKRIKREGRQIFGFAVEQAVIDSYVSVFKQAEIRLTSINIGVLSIFDYVAGEPALRDKPFVLNIVDGITLLSMIFTPPGGTNAFMSRTRLYGETGQELAVNISDSLSSLIQFNKSEGFPDLSHSLYLGLTQEDIATLKKMNPDSAITIGIPDLFKGVRGREKLGEGVHLSYLNARYNKGGINLLQSAVSARRREARGIKPRRMWPVLLLAVIASVMVPAAYLFREVTLLNSKIAQLRAYLASEEVSALSQELDELLLETRTRDSVANMLAEKLARELQTPAFTSATAEVITKTLGSSIMVDSLEYDAQNGSVTVGARADSETLAAEYIYELGKSPLIDAINYTGYSYTGDGHYSFTISIVLASTASGESEGAE